MSSQHMDHMWSWTIWTLCRLRIWQCVRLSILFYIIKRWKIQQWGHKMIWNESLKTFIHSTTFWGHQLFSSSTKRNIKFTQKFITVYKSLAATILALETWAYPKELRINNICKMMTGAGANRERAETNQRDLKETTEFSRPQCLLK